jgi:hypothetical protein
MARPEVLPLPVAEAGKSGAAVNVFRLRDKTVQVSGPFAGSLQLEGSLDGDAFAAIGAPLTAPGFVLVPMTVSLIRMRTGELTSAPPTAAIAGFDFRAM